MEEIIKQLEEYTHLALEEIEKATTLETLEEIRVKYLGKKGKISEVSKNLKSIEDEGVRREIGQKLTENREKVENALTNKKAQLIEEEKRKQLERERIDVSIPFYGLRSGNLHPLTQVREEVIRIFRALGFCVEEGPELELEEYNFDALNIPPYHPARDAQDSFYIKEGLLLRTQTSPVQIRAMRKYKNPPIAVVSPGRCFRRDTVDATHSHTFHQIEGLYIAENVSFSHLKGTLLVFARLMFGPDTNIRLRPDYFPFTEPSAEVAVTCPHCGGKGCKICKYTGWIEIAGAGMVHPKVLENGGIDPKKYTGFAFGMGIERIAMVKYKIPDIRLFYENDKRFLNQF